MPSLRLAQMLEISDTYFKTAFIHMYVKKNTLEMNNKNEKLSTIIGIIQRTKCEF